MALKIWSESTSTIVTVCKEKERKHIELGEDKERQGSFASRGVAVRHSGEVFTVAGLPGQHAYEVS